MSRRIRLYIMLILGVLLLLTILASIAIRRAEAPFITPTELITPAVTEMG